MSTYVFDFLIGHRWLAERWIGLLGSGHRLVVKHSVCELPLLFSLFFYLPFYHVRHPHIICISDSFSFDPRRNLHVYELKAFKIRVICSRCFLSQSISIYSRWPGWPNPCCRMPRGERRERFANARRRQASSAPIWFLSLFRQTLSKDGYRAGTDWYYSTFTFIHSNAIMSNF